MNNETEEFVILEHTASDGVHLDIMLEHSGVLLTWRLTSPPEKISSSPIRAHRIFDHPLRFLTYEGTVQKNTGAVKRIDKGACRWMEKSETALKAHLNGTLLNGIYLFTQQEQGPDWIMVRQ